jgi:hypothetical protein
LPDFSPVIVRRGGGAWEKNISSEIFFCFFSGWDLINDFLIFNI